VPVIAVEEVSGRATYKRFFEFAYGQFRDEPRWSPPLLAYERARLDPNRNRFFDTGDGEYFVARRGGVVAGRITAHVAAKGDEQGWFGFLDYIDDPSVAAALVEQAAAWLRDHGCNSMTGPASFTVDDEPGLLVDGFEVAGTTGRPWHPPWYVAHLEAAGLTRTDLHRTWRLAATGTTQVRPTDGRPVLAGRFADPRIVLPDIVAVPDLTAARGSALALGRHSKRRQWEGCTIVQIDGDAARLVPQLQGAAAGAGYRWVVSPWSPDADAPPETVHTRLTAAL
jgi:hypothetical protein